MRARACVHAYVCVYIYICVCARAYVGVCVRARACMHVCACVREHFHFLIPKMCCTTHLTEKDSKNFLQICVLISDVIVG